MVMLYVSLLGPIYSSGCVSVNQAHGTWEDVGSVLKTYLCRR